MGLTKTAEFTQEQNKIASIIKALGHPARIAIVEHLARVNQCINKDIVEELPLSQSTISQHLKALKEADIIKGEIEGTAMCYCLNTNTLNTISNYIMKTINEIKENKECC